MNGTAKQNKGSTFSDIATFSRQEMQKLPEWAQKNARFEGGFSLREQNSQLASKDKTRNK